VRVEPGVQNPGPGQGVQALTPAPGNPVRCRRCCADRGRPGRLVLRPRADERYTPSPTADKPPARLQQPPSRLGVNPPGRSGSGPAGDSNISGKSAQRCESASSTRAATALRPAGRGSRSSPAPAPAPAAGRGRHRTDAWVLPRPVILTTSINFSTTSQYRSACGVVAPCNGKGSWWSEGRARWGWCGHPGGAPLG
jgi:hypothetical protein